MESVLAMRTRALVAAWSVGALAGSAGCGGCAGEVVAAAPPTLATLPALVNRTPVLISGQKSPGTQVLVQTSSWSEAEAVGELDDNAVWTYSLKLEEGPNEVVVFARNAAGALGDPTPPQRVVLDSTPPPPVVLDPVPDSFDIPFGESTATVTLRGEREPGARVLIDEQERAEAGDNPTFTVTLNLPAGEHALSLVAADRAGNYSTPSVARFAVVNDQTPPPAPVLLSPASAVDIPNGVLQVPLTLRGSKEPGASLWVNGAERLGPTPESSFSVVVQIGAGNNPLRLSARDLSGNTSEDTLLEVWGKVSLRPPLLDDMPPLTNAPLFVVSGAKGPARVPVGIRAQNDAGGDAVTLAPDDELTFSVQLPLFPGRNLLRLVTIDERGFTSDEAPPLVVEYDDIPPAAPTFDAVTSLSLPPGATSGFAFISGDKEPGTRVELRGDFPGVVIAEGGASPARWTASVPAVSGINPYFAEAIDLAGNRSTPGVLEIIAEEGIAVPVVTNLSEDSEVFTNQQMLVMEGTRDPAHRLFLRRVGSEPTEWLAPGSASFSHTVSLSEGTNLLYLSARDDEGRRSAEAGPFRIVLDQVPPEAPRIEALDAVYTQEEVMIRGVKDELANVCMSQNGEPDCLSPARPPGVGIVVGLSAPTTFEFPWLLFPGQNEFCFVSTDRAGNTSPARCLSTVWAQPSRIDLVEPLPGAVVNSESFYMEAQVVDLVSETTAVSFCVGPGLDVCVEAQQQGAGTVFGGTLWGMRVTLSSPESGETYPVEVRARSDAEVESHARFDVVYLTYPRRFSETTTPTDSQSARVAVDSAGALHVVWQDDCQTDTSCPVGAASRPTNPPDIFYVRVEGGVVGPVTSLTDDIRESLNNYTSENESRSPDIAIDSEDRVHVVWQENGSLRRNASDVSAGEDFDIVHRFWTPGPGWSSASLVDRNTMTTDTANDRAPRLAPGTYGTMHLAWQQGTGLRYLRWQNGVWDTPFSVAGALGDIAVDGNNQAYVAFRQGTGADAQVYVTRVGASPWRVSTSSGVGAKSPVLELDLFNTLHIAWIEGSQIAYRQLVPPGSGVGTPAFAPVIGPELLSGAGALAQQPTLCIDNEWAGGSVLVAWTEEGEGSPYAAGTGDDADIYYTETSLGAVAFGDVHALPGAAGDNGRSYAPGCAPRPGAEMVFVWTDDSTGYGSSGTDDTLSWTLSRAE